MVVAVEFGAEAARRGRRRKGDGMRRAAGVEAKKAKKARGAVVVAQG